MNTKEKSIEKKDTLHDTNNYCVVICYGLVVSSSSALGKVASLGVVYAAPFITTQKEINTMNRNKTYRGISNEFEKTIELSGRNNHDWDVIIDVVDYSAPSPSVGWDDPGDPGDVAIEVFLSRHGKKSFALDIGGTLYDDLCCDAVDYMIDVGQDY